MATDYSARFSKAVGCSRHAMGGAAEDLSIEALKGDTQYVTIFDDFDGVVADEGFADAGIWTTIGWVGTDVGAPNNDLIAMNDPALAADCNSDIWIVPGDADDAGGNMQLDLVNGSVAAAVSLHEFKHLWIPGTGTSATILDETMWIFATRVASLSGDTVGGAGSGVGDWDCKWFIGWAEAGDADILVPGTGLIAVAGGTEGPLVGFHAREDGSVWGVAQRTFGTAIAEGTNATELLPAGGLDGTLINTGTSIGYKVWLDLALKMHITDMSDASANGTVDFYWRRVIPEKPLGEWIHHPVQLENQTPNNNVVLVPTIEVINGPTAGVDGTVSLDWWCMARNRLNRFSP